MIENARATAKVRPERKPDELLLRTIGTAVTRSERRRIGRCATGAGLTMSSWSRAILVREVARIEAGKAERRKARESTAKKSA